ncbi:MAG: amidase family protein [Gammaproteobacteria bacterium]|nr:amidase family protein [Gammaproteobacteria bacterium]MDH3448091.1 amidase family protein [Gammaproteobacteria bacterium]
MNGLRALSVALQTGRSSAIALVEQSLEHAHRAKSVFISINPGLANLANSIDRGRKKLQATPPLAGIPIALKDLFNIRNELTLAGSVVRKHYAEPESDDAEVVAPLRAAGMLFFGRTNMSEFAFSGIGKNPHYGTPLSIWDRDTGRLPGGSSSGSAVAIAEGIVPAALGSDTAGSCRIPAAFNGVVGVKPSHGRMSLAGIYPLSPTLDAPGPLAVDVDSCFILDQLMCARIRPGDDLPRLQPENLGALKFIIPEARVMTQLDEAVQSAFERSIELLQAAGAGIERQPLPALDHCDDFFIERPLVVYEVWQHHREMLAQYPDEYDPFVGTRISAGADIGAREQQQRYRERARIVADFNRQFSGLAADALLYPTVACVPPALAETDDADDARRVNLRCLRNTATVNYFDGCSISLPCHNAGDAPVGLMISSKNGDDEKLYRIAAAIEATIATRS